MKVLIRVVQRGLILLLLVVGGFLATVDRWAGTAIERGATHALGVDTHVGFVRVSFVAGTLGVSSLEIDNPPGYDADHLIEVGSIRLEVPPSRLRDPVVEVPIMELDRVSVSLEKEGGGTNYGTVLGNLKRFESQGDPAPGDPDRPPTRFIVKEIVIRDISAHIEEWESLGDLAAFDVVVPEVRLRDVGAHNADGVAMAELTDVVTKAVFTAIVRSGGNLPASVVGGISSGLGSLASVPVKGVGGVVPEPIRDGARAIGEGAADTGRAVRDGVGRLFDRARAE